MIKGFKDFILRGNVVDLAVAVVIGAAFTTVVKAFTDNIISPLLAALGGGTPGHTFGFDIRGGNDKTRVDFGNVISAVVNFVIVAAVIYFFIIVPMNLLLERRRRGEEPEPASPPEDIVLLQEIRDLLRDRPLGNDGLAGNDHPQPDRPQY
jgi:large conductance mechanosensitive channel